jgi:capsid protein
MPKNPQKSPIDRIIESISPEWALRRYDARMQISSRFEAARPTRERDLSDDPIERQETEQNQADRYQIIRETRDLFDNFAPIKGAVGSIATHCTPTGWQSSHADRDVSKMVSAYVEKRLDANAFDLSGRHDGLSMFALSVHDSLIDGDNGWHHFKPTGAAHSFIQPIRGHRIGDPSRYNSIYGFEHGEGQRRKKYWHISGLNVVQSTGRVASYEIYREQNNLGGSFVLDTVIPAERFLHLFDPAHLDSYRGVPPFHACIREIQDLKTVWDYQRKQMEAAASISGVIKREGGRVRAGDSHITLEDSSGPTSQDARQSYYRVKQGVFKYLEPNESIEQFRQDNPGGQFWEYVKWLMSTAAWSLELPYSFLFDASGSGGAPLRFEINRSSKALQRFRRNALKRTLNVWLKRTIAEGIISQELPLSAAQYDSYLAGRWTFPKDPTADSAREGKVHLEEARAGVRSWGSLSELLGEGSFAQVIDSKETEIDIVLEAAQRISKKHPNIPIETILDRLQAVFPNQLAQPQQQSDAHQADAADQMDD